jgi:hypothetical protein
MAKATTAKAPKKVKKAAKAVTLKAKPDGGKKAGKKKSKANGKGMDVLLKLADHPLVGELLAVGAIAAVAAIAEQGVSSKGKEKKRGASRAAVKAAGTAAAAAIGKRLISEFEEVKKASKPKPAKA